jgi:hypothetical protein
MALEIDSREADPVTNSCRLGSKLGNVQQFLDIAQTVGPLSIPGPGNRSASKSPAVVTTNLVQKIVAAALSSVLALAAWLVASILPRLPPVAAALLGSRSQFLRLSLTFAALSTLS